MEVVTKEFQENILDGMKDYSIFTQPERASFAERFFIRMMHVKDLHPNPEDEFSNPEIGPSNDIVGEYTKSITERKTFGKKPYMDPIIVEKLTTGGYMIRNGHHRWLAAKKLGMKRVPVRIVNPTQETDILSRLTKLNNTMCVAFDLEEVLFGDPSRDEIDELPGALQTIYPWPIRKEAPLLINSLRRMGFDVWVYTENFYPTQYIHMTMKMHRTQVDGVVTGLVMSSISQELRHTFRNKYHTMIHVDKSRLLWVNTDTNESESFDIPSDDTWARRIASKIQEITTSDAYRTGE